MGKYPLMLYQHIEYKLLASYNLHETIDELPSLSQF